MTSQPKDPDPKASASEARVLVMSPLPRDVTMATSVLGRAGFYSEGFTKLEDLVATALQNPPGMLLVAAEALFSTDAVASLMSLLESQPAWSDLPVSIITHSRIADPHELRAVRGLEHLHSVTFLDRPVRVAALVSTVRAALQARSRQYQVRDLLLAAERDVRQRDEFLAMLSHELRNPLAAISNATQVMQLQPQKSAEIIPILDRQTGMLSRMVDDLLDVARITSGKIKLKAEQFDAGSALHNALETVAPDLRTRNHTLDLDHPRSALSVEGDPARMAQVFSNLIHNAAKYTDPGGNIRVSLIEEDGEAVFRVRDSGIGIDTAQIKQIFELFAQGERNIDRAEGGLGIGLTIARQLVHMHGGNIAVHSDGPGSGSEFCVRLPLAAQATTRTAMPEEYAFGGSASRVLVVDDNQEVADGLALLVEALGHEARTVYKGRDALTYARDFRPDIILLDLGMPEMDGFAVARALRSLPYGSHLTIVALTGYGDDATVAKSRSAGFDHHLLKPAGVHALQTILAHAQAGELHSH